MPTPLGMMTNSATVTSRVFQGGDDHGALELDSSTTSSAFACSIQPQSSGEGVDYGRAAGTVRAVMYYPSSVTITKDDIVTSSAVVWKAIGPPRDVAGRLTFFEIDLEREV